jgi:hypothetical protein
MKTDLTPTADLPRVPKRGDLDWVILATPDLGDVLRGKALSAAQFDGALSSGATITDLILAVDRLDEPIMTSVGVGPGSGSKDLVLWPAAALGLVSRQSILARRYALRPRATGGLRACGRGARIN